jgi:hypothetical protein
MPHYRPVPFPRLMLLPCAALLAACAPALRQAEAPLHDVVVLVGQSNMSGRGAGFDPQGQAAPDGRILMWDPAAGRLAIASDPLPHQDLAAKPVRVGPGLSFARSYLASQPPGTRIVLVPAAYGGTGFSDAAGSWRVDRAEVSQLTAEAVARANAAMRAARAGGGQVRVAAILWHQGETDGANGMDASDYAQQLTALAGYLRSHIDGAGPATPFVVGQYVPSQIATTPALRAIAESNRTLPERLARSTCVGSEGLAGNATPDTIHFDAASQRAMGERYAAALAALSNGTGAADCRW